MAKNMEQNNYQNNSQNKAQNNYQNNSKNDYQNSTSQNSSTQNSTNSTNNSEKNKTSNNSKNWDSYIKIGNREYRHGCVRYFLHPREYTVIKTHRKEEYCYDGYYYSRRGN